MFTEEDVDFYSSIFGGLLPEDLQNILQLAKLKTIVAGEVYINQEYTSRKLAYIKTGLIRTYLLKEKGDEITLMLRWEKQFVASVDGIFFNRPSRFIYQAIEDTVLMELDYDKIQAAINNTPRLSAARNDFLLEMLAQAVERLETFVLLSPEKRYLKLLHEKPNIVNRVPGKFLATMLGITPVSFSRIRKRISHSE